MTINQALRQRIREVAAPLIERGCTPEQVRQGIYRKLGIGIGGGGGGSGWNAQPASAACPICGASGGGGHGGMCPEGGGWDD